MFLRAHALSQGAERSRSFSPQAQMTQPQERAVTKAL